LAGRRSYLHVGVGVEPTTWKPIQRLGQMTWEKRMTWKTPKIVEVPVGMEINMYACAARK
jgi:coenzyme PQQ precursor peptide PqqA